VDSVGALVPFVLIVAAFYVLIIRPARTRQRTQQRLVDQLSVGARVMTTSGLFAVVEAVEDDGVLLEVAPGVTMRFTKAAVARILPEPDADDDAAEDDAGDSAADSDADDAPDAALEPDSRERPT
jgi:preprotein translocase subunit YajC